MDSNILSRLRAGREPVRGQPAGGGPAVADHHRDGGVCHAWRGQDRLGRLMIAPEVDGEDRGRIPDRHREAHPLVKARDGSPVRRIKEFEGLRGVLAWWVVVFHLYLWARVEHGAIPRVIEVAALFGWVSV